MNISLIELTEAMIFGIMKITNVIILYICKRIGSEIQMTIEQDYEKKLKIARHYYEDGLTQQAIADALNISRPTVSKFLKEAREEGLVQIKVIDIKKKGSTLQLEEELKSYFDLNDIKIVECKGNETQELKNRIGEAAAIYLETILHDGLKIGISWGSTLRAMIDNLRGNKIVHNLEITTLVGGSGDMTYDVHANILAEEILKKYHGLGYFLYAPAIVDSEEVWNVLMMNQETRKLLERARNVDVALVGIGAPIKSSNLVKTGYFKKDEIKEIHQKGAVGDICSRFFDLEGKECQLEINQRIVGIELEDLKEIKQVIGIAGGAEKICSIYGALQGGFIDTLITDESTAREILNLTTREENPCGKQ